MRYAYGRQLGAGGPLLPYGYYLLFLIFAAASHQPPGLLSPYLAMAQAQALDPANILAA